MSAQNQIVQKKVVRLQPEYRRKRQFYNMLLEIVPKKMMSKEKFDEYSPDDIQFFVEQEIEKMSDEESKSCYQVEFGKIVDDECGDEVYKKKPVFKFVAEACGCEFFPEEAEKIEFECDRNNDNAYCPDCYDGEYDEECVNCDCLCSSEYQADIDGDEVPVCEDCFEQMEKCEMCGDPTDESPWEDIQDDVLYCSSCKEKYKVRIAECEAIVHSSSSREEALAKWENIKLEKAIAKAKAISEEIEIIKQMKAEAEAEDEIIAENSSCDCPVCVAEPDEDFEAEVSNSHLLEVFGGEVVYNKVKELAKYPDLSSTLRVFWKFGKEHLSLYVYIDGEPFLDAVYPRNHSCDMFYMLEELKKEQECEVPSILEEGEKEVNGVCYECGFEGKFIGEEGDDWACLECSSI